MLMAVKIVTVCEYRGQYTLPLNENYPQMLTSRTNTSLPSPQITLIHLLYVFPYQGDASNLSSGGPDFRPLLKRPLCPYLESQY